MASCFYIVLNMSLTAAAVSLAVLALRLVLRRVLPASVLYALWALVLLRLLLPVSLPSEASLFNAVGRMVSVPAGPSEATVTNAIRAVNGYFPMRFKTPALAGLFHWAGVVWLAGAALGAGGMLTLYILTARRFRTAARMQNALTAGCAAEMELKRDIPLLVSGDVSSPVVFGIFKPRVIVPPGFDEDREALRYALLHEYAHIRRGDNLGRVLAALALCAHWFNPLMWLCFTLSARDMELACDAKVLNRLDGPQRRGYALALAGLAERRQPALASAFGSSAVKQRIVGIVYYKKRTLIEILLSAVLLCALAAALLSNPAM